MSCIFVFLAYFSICLLVLKFGGNLTASMLDLNQQQCAWFRICRLHYFCGRGHQKIVWVMMLINITEESIKFIGRKYMQARHVIACERQTFLLRSSPLRDFTQGGTSANQWQKFHTDDVNQCLPNKSGSHGVPNADLFNCTFLLVDFGKCFVHLRTSSIKILMLLLQKNINHKYWLFCYRFIAFKFDLCGLLSFDVIRKQ